MNNIQEKIKKSSKVMATVSKISYISLMIGMFIPLSALVWVVVNPKADILAIKGLKFISMQGQYLHSTEEVIAEMCTVIVAGIFILFILMTAYRMFRSINTDILPFSKTNATRMKKIGIIIMIYSFVVPVARAGFYKIFVLESNIQITFDIPFVLLALIFIFIATVFDYGAELQRQSDETL